MYADFSRKINADLSMLHTPTLLDADFACIHLLLMGQILPRAQRSLISVWPLGGATCMSETSFGHISGTNKDRDLRLGTYTP